MHGDNQAGPRAFNRDIYIYTLGHNETPRDIVAIVPHELAFQHGLADESIIGALRRPVSAGPGVGAITPENFVPSRAFGDFLHRFVAAEIYRSPAARKQAAVQRSGYLYIMDGRTPDPAGAVPPEDILGAVQIGDGMLVPGTYQRNFKHQLFTRHGFFLLSEELERGLLAVVHQLTRQRGNPA